MAFKGKRQAALWLGAGLLLAAGAVAGFKKRDREQFPAHPRRLRKPREAEWSAADPARGGDWPQWRGPNRDGRSPERGLAWAWPAGGPPVLWKRPVGRGFSSVVVAAGRACTMAQDEGREGPAE